MNETASIPTVRIGKFRIGLLLILIPILIAWWILIHQVPITFSDGIWFGFETNQKSKTATIDCVNARSFQVEPSTPWSQSLAFNPQSGTLVVEDAEAIAAKKTESVGSQFYSSESGEKGWWRLITNDNLGETVRDVEFEFPVVPSLVNDRFAVGFDKTTIWTRDLLKKDAELVETPSISDCWHVFKIKNTDLFYRCNFAGIPAAKTPTTTFNFEVFEIDDQAIPSLVTSWPASANPRNMRNPPITVGGNIVWLNPKSLTIEYRCPTDGSLIESHSLLEDHDPTVQAWGFSQGCFSIDTPTGIQYFDLETRQWIKFPGNNFSLSKTSPNDQLWLAYDVAATPKRIAVIIDKGNKKPGARIENFYDIDFLSDESLLALSPESGITLREISVKDGSVIRSWQPFWWVLPLLLTSILAFIAWSLAWLRCTGTSAVEVWFSIFTLSAMPLLAFVTRMKLVGDPFDLGRCPNQYTQAIMFALAVLSTIWLINSKQRVVIRLIPMLVGLAILSAAVTYTFSGDLNSVALGVLQMAVPASLFVLVFLFFRGFRYRLLSQAQASAINKTLSLEDGSKPIPASTQERTSLITVQDMFLLVGAVALVFATITPLLPSLKNSLGSVGTLLGGIGQFIFGATIQISAWWIAMTGKKLSPIKVLIVVAAFLLVLAEPVERFSTDGTTVRDWMYLGGLLWPGVTRIVLGAFVATFMFGLAFRYGGWSWERVPRNV